MQNSCLYFDDFFPVKLYATFLLPIKCIFGQFLHYLIHVLWLQQYRLIRKLQMKEKYLGKVEFGQGIYFIFLSTQKKDRKKRVLNMAKLQFHIKIVLFTLFVNCFLVFVDLTIKMVVKMNSKSRFIYSSFFCLEH